MTTLAETGIPILDANGWAIAVRLDDGRVFDYCKRCGGSGHYSFNPQDGTRCFGCNGSGLGPQTTTIDAVRRAENRQKAKDRRVRTEQARLRKQQAARQAWADEHPALVQFLADFAADDNPLPGNGLLHDLAGKAQWQPLTTAQTELAERLVEEYTERYVKIEKAKAAQAAAGHFGRVGEKITTEVEVVFTKMIESFFNGRETTSNFVIMKTAEGHTLKTFSSGAFGWSAEKGQHLTITGTVKAHEERDGLPETSLTRVKVA